MQKLEQIGDLTCRTVQNFDESQKPEQVVILCHGFGAPGTDLVPLGSELLSARHQLAESTRIIFPEAPLTPPELAGGRAWWPLDVEQLQRAMQFGEIRDLRGDHPPGLTEAREKLISVIAATSGETGLPLSRFVLGGFSQGAMLATDVALRLDDLPAALCIWSGTLLCESEWKELIAKRGPLRVLQSHGKTDPILPFQAATELRDLFAQAAFDGEFIEFAGVHTIPAEALDRFADLLIELLVTMEKRDA
ncbi:MAG: hypothetical protein VB858_13540 [Planctomycetaceae bacterium]|jgi:phospholipase/carboxylesterase